MASIAYQRVMAYDPVEITAVTGSFDVGGWENSLTILVRDDNPLDGRGPWPVAIGKHRLRVETSNDVLFTGELDIKAGEQTVPLAPARKDP